MLFVGIRNKYCCICQKSKNSKKVAPDHQCFLNWKKSSTSMEADGVVEGFMKSEEMHGLKYNCLIGKQLKKNYSVKIKKNVILR